MSVQLESPVRISRRTWRVSWTSTLSDPTFYIYQDGILIAQTPATSWDFTIRPGATMVIEVLDDANTSPTDVADGRAVLTWYRRPAADRYRIETRRAG